jgi:hypothetical protein
MTQQSIPPRPDIFRIVRSPTSGRPGRLSLARCSATRYNEDSPGQVGVETGSRSLANRRSLTAREGRSRGTRTGRSCHQG